MFYIYSAALVTFYIDMAFPVWKRTQQLEKEEMKTAAKGSS